MPARGAAQRMTKRRRSSARRLSYGETRAGEERGPSPTERALHIHDLPDALLLEASADRW